MRFILIFLLTPIFFTCAQNAEEIMTVDVSNDIVIPKNYVVSKTKEQINIDGIANEPSWQRAPWTDKFIDIEGEKTPKYDTQVKMLWDDKFLYVFAKLEEPHIWGDITKRDAIIFHNNDFEVFIDPSGSGFRYGEIELNALNTVWDLFLNKPYRVGANPLFEWNLDQLDTAVHIEGTLNDPSNQDSYWTIEMAIPLLPYYRMIHGSKRKMATNEQWRINFSRVQWDHDIIDGVYKRKKVNDKRQEEYNWVWSNQKTIDMHQPEKWGYIQFSELENSNVDEFEKDEDLLIKQTAYALFRNTRHGKLRELRKVSSTTSQPLMVKYTEDKSINATYYKTNSGFEYVITSPTSGNTYVIDQIGKLKVL